MQIYYTIFWKLFLDYTLSFSIPTFFCKVFSSFFLVYVFNKFPWHLKFLKTCYSMDGEKWSKQKQKQKYPEDDHK